MWDLQLSNWLIGFAGSAATFVVFALFALFLFILYRSITKLQQAERREPKAFAVVGLQLVIFGVVLVSMFTFQSNAPKYQLQVADKPSNQESNKPLADVQDLSPEKLSAEQSSERLEALRDAQKQSTSIADKEQDKDGNGN